MHDTNINQIDGWNVSEKTIHNFQPQKLYNPSLFILVEDMFLTSAPFLFSERTKMQLCGFLS